MKLKVDSGDGGVIKPVHSVGQPPILGWDDYKMFHYLKEIGVKYSRLHDTGGAFGKGIYVDIPNVFRDFDANPYDPASYDFAFTDKLMAALVENGIEPYFRLGVTIENQCMVKAYRIFPPKDNMQWARICEGIIRHYTQGWANGFHYHISHWEIWNEPDNMPDMMENRMWRGTFEQYLELYGTTSKYLKKRFPDLMIGGYGCSGMNGITATEADYKKLNGEKNKRRNEYLLKSFHQFIDYVVKNQCPLDFFSFHFYDKLENAPAHIAYVRKTLDEAGLKKTEMSLNEWMPSHYPETMGWVANITAMVLIMQDSAVDDAELYDAKCGMGYYSPLFDCKTYQPKKAYYGLKAFNELNKLHHAKKITGTIPGVYAVAAADGDVLKIMLVNTAEKSVKFTVDLPAGFQFQSAIITDETHTYEPCAESGSIGGATILLLTYSKGTATGSKTAK